MARSRIHSALIPLVLFSVCLISRPLSSATPPSRFAYSAAKNLPRNRFVFAPWQMATSGNRPFPLPKAYLHQYEDLYLHFPEWIPSPKTRWTNAPDPETIEFDEETGMPCGEKAVYFYFRTTLNLPPDVDRLSVRLVTGAADDGLAVYVNGELVGHNSPTFYSGSIFLGHDLHPGPNSVVLVLADWCAAAALKGIRFTSGPEDVAPARRRIATLPTPRRLRARMPPPPQTPAPKPPPPPLLPGWSRGPAYRAPTGPAAAEDWLRARRDESNSAHSRFSLRLPLKEAWSFSKPSTDARVWRNVVLTLDNTQWWLSPTLYALDLNTGRERWRRTGVKALGDVSPRGQAALLTTDDALLLIDARTGNVLWKRPVQTDSPPAIHDGFVYLIRGGLAPFRLSDGEAMPVGAAVEGWRWGSPVFTKDRILFGTGIWLFDLDLNDPARGTKYYNGGSSTILSGSYLVTEGWYWQAQGFRLEGKWTRPLWGWRTSRDKAHCWVPHGSGGAVLLKEVPNLGPSRLKLYDIPTGHTLWSRDEDPVAFALSAGGQVIFNGTQTVKGKNKYGIDTYSQSNHMTALDARSGRLLWRSRTDMGQPLAAVQGRLLTSTGDRLRCLR